MCKQEFLAQLRKGLSGLPRQDMEERLNFYSEMIDDRMEEGLTESEAVSAIGSVSNVITQILAEIPITKLVKAKIKPSRSLMTWEIVLLVLGSPIWLSLLIAAFAVILAVYIVVWSVVISIWAVFVSLAACAFGGVVAAAIMALQGNWLAGIAVFGAGIVCFGLSIVAFYGCKAATRGILWLTKRITLGIKNGFMKKEAA